MLKNKIKKVFYPLVRLIISSSLLWKIITYFLRFGSWLKYEKSKQNHQAAEINLFAFFDDKVVRQGFFKGLKYLNFESFGSSIFPKLLGSYEIELMPVFNSIKNNNYKNIVDVGCAEGFYAIGLALHFKNATIYAYDIDNKALELCAKLAENNNIRDQIILRALCATETLNELNFKSHSLVICDCEGYERVLFDASNFESLKHTDLIIELHPFYAEDVKEYLISLFKLSHYCSIVSSRDSNRKIHDFKNNLQGLNKMEQLKAVEEGRPFTMEWLVAESSFYKK